MSRTTTIAKVLADFRLSANDTDKLVHCTSGPRGVIVSDNAQRAVRFNKSDAKLTLIVDGLTFAIVPNEMLMDA